MSVGRVISLALGVAAVIHLLPVSGALGVDRLSVLYGVTFDDPNIEILMRHRSVLFGLLGLFLLYAAFNVRLYLAALVAGIVSVVSFLFMARVVGGYNTEIARVITADLVALVFLAVGFVMYVVQRVKGGWFRSLN